MSTSTSGIKMGVTGLLRAAYRWLRDEPQPEQPVATPPPTPAPPPASHPPQSPASVPPAVRPPAASTPNGDTLHLPLQPVLDTLPPELKAKVRQQQVGALTIPVPTTKIMAQLSQGAVKITFGELRLAAPGVFQLSADLDQALVSLPLNEILKRISVAKLVRRADQKVVEVPEDVTSPFGEKGQGLVLSDTTEKPSLTPRLARGINPAAAGTASPAVLHRGVTPAPHAAPMMPPSRGVAPVSPAKPAAAVPLPKPNQPSATLPPRPAVPMDAPAPAIPPRPAGRNGHTTSIFTPPSKPGSPDTAFASAAMAASAPAGDVLQVPLLGLMNTWPQAVRLEIAQLNLMDAKVVVPVPILEKGLRQGKVEFPWKLVRAWIRPEVRSQVTTNDAIVLELPLSIVAPLFVAHRKPAAKAQRRVAVDETIPNLFFGFPQGDAGGGLATQAAPVSAPAPTQSPDTNFYVWGDNDDRPVPEQAAPAAPPATGTELLRRYATPNEVVARAAALDGVAGALVALPDGLAVASRVPPNFNPDTLAAFLPQIFGKVSQCTKELRMGNLNNLNFTVGNVPWKIFRVNSVFFAAFGRAEEPLPTAQLAALAAELDRKAKVA